MLRLIDPADGRPEPAYPMPFRIDRDRLPFVTLTNESADVLTRVLVTSLRTGELLTSHARVLRPGEALAFRMPVRESTSSAVALVNWIRREREYLYRVAF